MLIATLKRNFETGESNSAITVAIAIRASIGENLTSLADRCASLNAKLFDHKQHTTIVRAAGTCSRSVCS
jgi:hypothetical protein